LDAKRKRKKGKSNQGDAEEAQDEEEEGEEEEEEEEAIQDTFAKPEAIRLHEVNMRPPTFRSLPKQRVRNKARQSTTGKTCGTFVKTVVSDAPTASKSKKSLNQMEALRAQVMGRYKQMKKSQAPKRGFNISL
jgi:hypothetical protein